MSAPNFGLPDMPGMPDFDKLTTQIDSDQLELDDILSLVPPPSLRWTCSTMCKASSPRVVTPMSDVASTQPKKKTALTGGLSFSDDLG